MIDEREIEAVLCRDDIDATEASRVLRRVSKAMDKVELQDAYPAKVNVHVTVAEYDAVEEGGSE